MTTYTDMPLVLVEWVDIESNPQWQSVEDATARHCPVHFGVGFILKMDKDELTLVHNTGRDDPRCDNTIYPRGCVKSIKVLRIGGDYKRGRKK